METKFTKGPWVVSANKAFFDIGPEDKNGHNGLGEHVCIGVMFKDEANAHLIAVAPEMYEMLESLRENYGANDPTGIEIDKLLAKARGE